MKTLSLTVLGTGLFLAFVEFAHIQKHDDLCKTEGEWRMTLPLEIRDQL